MENQINQKEFIQSMSNSIIESSLKGLSKKSKVIVRKALSDGYIILNHRMKSILLAYNSICIGLDRLLVKINKNKSKFDLWIDLGIDETISKEKQEQVKTLIKSKPFNKHGYTYVVGNKGLQFTVDSLETAFEVISIFYGRKIKKPD